MKLLVLHFFLTSSHFGDSAHIEAVLGCYGNRPSQVETRRVELKVSDGKVPFVTSVSGVIPAELRLEDLQEELKSLGQLIVLLVVLQQKKKQKKTIHSTFSGAELQLCYLAHQAKCFTQPWNTFHKSIKPY